MTTEQLANLKTLKPGDKVFVCYLRLGKPILISRTVLRVSKTLITVEGYRFRTSDGSAVKENPGSELLLPTDPQVKRIQDSYRIEALRREIRKALDSCNDSEMLEAVRALLSSSMPRK